MLSIAGGGLHVTKTFHMPNPFRYGVRCLHPHSTIPLLESPNPKRYMLQTSPLFWTLIGVASGSVPWSVILGRLALKKDIRAAGEDHNPGAFNVMKASGSAPLFVAAFLLDGLKAAIPIFFAVTIFGIGGWAKVPVCIAPLVGHCWSPLLKFNGGKGISTTGGVWGGQTLIWEGGTVTGVLIGLMFSFISNSGYAVLGLMLGWLGYLVATTRTDLPTLAIWLLNTIIVLYKYRTDLAQPLAFRSWYTRRIDALFSRGRS